MKYCCMFQPHVKNKSVAALGIILILSLSWFAGSIFSGEVKASTVGSLAVYAWPDGFNIYVDGEFSGVTRGYYSGPAVVNGISEGIHSVRLSRTNYRDWNKQINITSGQTTSFWAALEIGNGNAVTRNEVIAYDSQFGSMTIWAAEGVNCYINGEYAGTIGSSAYGTVLGLLLGNYTVKLTKSGFIDASKQAAVSIGQETNVYGYLEIAPPLLTPTSPSTSTPTPTPAISTSTSPTASADSSSTPAVTSSGTSQSSSTPPNTTAPAASPSSTVQSSNARPTETTRAIASVPTNAYLLYLAAFFGIILVSSIAIVAVKQKRNRLALRVKERLGKHENLVKTTDHVFISHVEEDFEITQEIAQNLENSGYKSWYFERDTTPGRSYILDTSEAIEKSLAVILIISKDSIRSREVHTEVVTTHQSGKPFIPVLHDITFTEFQRQQQEWSRMIGTAASVTIPRQGVQAVIPRILAGLEVIQSQKKSAP